MTPSIIGSHKKYVLKNRSGKTIKPLSLVPFKKTQPSLVPFNDITNMNNLYKSLLSIKDNDLDELEQKLNLPSQNSSYFTSYTSYNNNGHSKSKKVSYIQKENNGQTKSIKKI